MRVVGNIYLSKLGRGSTGYWGVLFGVMYGEWYGVCDFVELLVVKVCVDYGCVNVFYVFGSSRVLSFVSMSVV